jgi:hypothetical protein
MPFLVYWLAWYLTTHQPRDSRYFCTCLENILSSMPRAGLRSLLQTMSENVVELAEVVFDVLLDFLGLRLRSQF